MSASVLRAIFGSGVKNIVGGTVFGKKYLIDHEPVVRDVCTKCNNEYLSPYDSAAVNLIKELIQSNDPTDLRLLVTNDSLGWLIKTHLNFMRVIKDRVTSKFYPISDQLKSALVQRAEIPGELFRILIEGWVGESYFWDADDPRRIPWFGYKSVLFPSQRIVISEFRMKTLSTWLVIPSDACYESFDQRVNSFLGQALQMFSIQPQLVDSRQAIEDGYIDLKCVLPVEKVNQFIRSQRDQS